MSEYKEKLGEMLKASKKKRIPQDDGVYSLPNGNFLVIQDKVYRIQYAPSQEKIAKLNKRPIEDLRRLWAQPGFCGEKGKTPEDFKHLEKPELVSKLLQKQDIVFVKDWLFAGPPEAKKMKKLVRQAKPMT